MALETVKDKNWDFIFKDKRGRGFEIKFKGQKRIVLGTSETCDVIIKHREVSPLHLIIEFNNDRYTLFDLSSENGTFVNGQRILKSEIKTGDQISLGEFHFTMEKLVSANVLPPVLRSMNDLLPLGPTRKLPRRPPPLVAASKTSRPILTSKQDVESEFDVPYPLSLDPQADFSEYIFEDSDQVFPIFKYEVNQSSVEVILLYKGQILSVDYIPDNQNVYITGAPGNDTDFSYPYLRREVRDLFVENLNNEIFVHPLAGHKIFKMGDDGDLELKDSKTINLNDGDILRLLRGPVQIFVRKSERPPSVRVAPVMRRDPDLRYFLFLMLLLVSIFMAVVTFVPVKEEPEEEKAPEKIATILYTRPLKFEVPKVNVEKKIVEKKVDEKKIEEKKIEPEPQKEEPVEKAKEIVKEDVPKKVEMEKAGNVTKQDNAKVPDSKIVERKKVQKAPEIATTKDNLKTHSQKVDNQKSASASKQVPANAVAPGVGRVETFNSSSFKSSLNTLLQKGGAVSNSSASVNTASSSSYVGVKGNSNQKGALVRAEVTDSSGSMSDATVGKLDRGKGVEGIISKSSIAVAGIPAETVVKGMDPSIIRKILMEHLNEFRLCYKSALKQSTKAFGGVVSLDFIINGAGNVSKASASADALLPLKVRRCVINVVYGIKFPSPPGGGTVEVKQPINFYPTYN